MSITIDKLASEVMKELVAYSDEKFDEVKEIVEDEAAALTKNLKNNSPKDTGKYAKSWKSSKRFENSSEIRVIVHDKEYRLTHLLEKGHAKRGGGRVKAIPHIAPAEEHMRQNVDRRIKEL